jgi:hypothetical protein
MDSLHQLIERLQHLHLEQAQILQALENIAIEPVATVAPNIAAEAEEAKDTEAIAIPTTIQTNERDTAPMPTPTPTAEAVPVTVPVPTVFYIGQQVYITNCITHISLIRHATEADRTAIVSHFTASRVAIRTINSYHTHQHSKNLRPL